MRMNRQTILVAALLACMPAVARADVKLPAVFSNQMVLQRDRAVPIWGWAEPGEKVRVSLAGKTADATADADGKWRTKLPALPAGGPHEMVVEGKNKLQLQDVLVGEVWICSGQSNMGWTVRQSTNASQEIAESTNPQIRMFTVQRSVADEPQADCQGQWQQAGPQTTAAFSAVGYFYARKLQNELGVPVGMINTSWGGTLCEAWTSRAALEGNAAFKPILSRKPPKDRLKNGAAVLYNAMVAPLVPYAVRGTIWYQGEANVGRAAQYANLFPTMIRDWRNRWGQQEFPFLFVQLAPFRYPKYEPQLLAELWDAQFKTLREVKNTGMAVTTDIATRHDIHPPNKQDVGKRLALWALATVYDRDLVYSGPLYKSMEVDGNKIRLQFEHVGSGLKTRDGQPPNEFTIAAQDGEFVPAQAKIEGDTIIVWSEEVKEPAAVRMGWHHTAQPNLMNQEGLPASPFRTDERKLTTAGVR